METYNTTTPTGLPTAPWNATTFQVADLTDTKADVTVSDGDTYLVRVRAVAGANGSYGYLAGTVTAAGVPTPPEGVTAVVDEATGSTVNVEWTSIPENTETDITGYIVSWVNTDNPITGSRGAAAVSGAGTGEYSITGLNPGMYTVTVVAVNHVGKSTPGAAAAVPEVLPPPE